MATRLYIGPSDTTGFTPAVSSKWNGVSGGGSPIRIDLLIGQKYASPSTAGDSIQDLSGTNNNWAVCVYQAISPPLKAYTETLSAIKSVGYFYEANNAANAYLSMV